MMLITVNCLSILMAAVAAWLFGGVYYTALSRPWLAAQGKTMEQCQAEQAGKSDVAKYRAVRPRVRRRTDHGLGALRHPGALNMFTLRAGLISGAAAGSASC